MEEKIKRFKDLVYSPYIDIRRLDIKYDEETREDYEILEYIVRLLEDISTQFKNRVAVMEKAVNEYWEEKIQNEIDIIRAKNEMRFKNREEIPDYTYKQVEVLKKLLKGAKEKVNNDKGRSI